MLSSSDTLPSDVLPRFTTHGLEVAFLVPTRTGLEKSIIDAVGPLRDFFHRKGFHDYSTQPQGSKILRKAFYVHPHGVEDTKVSLYRPQTKDGDPRIWPYALTKYAKASNLLALLVEDEVLYIVNASDPKLLASVDDPQSPLGRLAAKYDALDPIAKELVDMLREIGKKGFVPTLRGGDTGVGFTLETLLGIKANTSRTPDFKGIEIKASRRSGGASQANRVNLFSQVPNWSRSKLGNGLAILREFGYERAGRLQLYCTVGARPNPQGLYFDTANEELLWNRARTSTGTRDVVCWETDSLAARLLEKHPATMWIKAKCRGDRACEEFHYVEATYTRNPVTTSLIPLIGDGTVTMDYTLSLRENGTARDHGYLFKIHPEDLPALFPPPRRIPLID